MAEGQVGEIGRHTVSTLCWLAIRELEAIEAEARADGLNAEAEQYGEARKALKRASSMAWRAWQDASNAYFAQEQRRPQPSKEPRRGLIYVFRDRENGEVKIGWTHHDVERRRRSVEQASGRSLEIVGTIPDCTMNDEAELHLRFEADRLAGEWFTESDEIRAWLDVSR